MLKIFGTNAIIKAGLALALIFAGLVTFFPNGDAHEILNGVFIGVGLMVYMTFSRVTWQTLLGRGPYRRGQLIALSLAIIWLAATIRVLLSIAYRASNESAWLLNLPFSALMTYLFIVAGVIQIIAPSVGQTGDEGRFMHGHSVGWIWFAAASGVTAATVVIWLQRSSMLLPV